MPSQRLKVCIGSVLSLLAFAGQAAPVQIEASADSALNAPISGLWNQREALTSQLARLGLVAAVANDDHFHDHGQGQGGNDEGEMGLAAEGGRIDNDTLEGAIHSLADHKITVLTNLDALKYSTYTNNSPNINLSDALAIQPVSNPRVSSPFGYRNFGGRGEFHPGIDLAVPYGSSIFSTGSGVVVYAGWKNGYGNFIEIDHGNGFITRYGHSSRLLVSVGDQITKNQQIAMVGCTGRCTGPHLHYEVLLNGQRQNPATYLALAPRRDE